MIPLWRWPTRPPHVFWCVIDGIPRLPIRIELGVEPPQRLDLHGVAHPPQYPRLDALRQALAGLAGQHGPHGGKVEPEAVAVPGPQLLDGLNHREVHEAIGVLAVVAAHQVEGEATDPGRRHVLAKGHRRAEFVVAVILSGDARSRGGGGARPAPSLAPGEGPVHHRQKEAGVVGVEGPAEGHGESPLHVAATALGHDPLQRSPQGGVQLRGVVETDPVAVPGDPVDGLPQSLEASALQPEAAYSHHALIPDVEVMHAGRAIDRQPLLTGAQPAERPPVLVDVAAKSPPGLLPFGDGPIGSGETRHTPPYTA